MATSKDSIRRNDGTPAKAAAQKAWEKANSYMPPETVRARKMDALEAAKEKAWKKANSYLPDETARQMPKVKVAPTPKPKATVKPNIKAAEAAFQKMIKAGKVKDLEKARKEIEKKYGARPNGYTN